MSGALPSSICKIIKRLEDGSVHLIEEDDPIIVEFLERAIPACHEIEMEIPPNLPDAKQEVDLERIENGEPLSGADYVADLAEYMVGIGTFDTLQSEVHEVVCRLGERYVRSIRQAKTGSKRPRKRSNSDGPPKKRARRK